MTPATYIRIVSMGIIALSACGPLFPVQSAYAGCYCDSTWFGLNDQEQSPSSCGGSNNADGHLMAGSDSGGSSQKAYAKVWGHPGAATLAGDPYEAFTGDAWSHGARLTKAYVCRDGDGKQSECAPWTTFEVDVMRKFTYISHGNPVTPLPGMFGSVTASGSASLAISTPKPDCSVASSLSVNWTSSGGLSATGTVTITWPPAISGSLGISANSWDTGAVSQIQRHLCQFDNKAPGGQCGSYVAVTVAVDAEANAQAGGWAHGTHVYVSAEATSFTLTILSTQDCCH